MIMRFDRQLWKRIVGYVLAALLSVTSTGLTGSSIALADHSYGAHYAGSHSRPCGPSGGTFEFDVTADGRYVANIEITNVWVYVLPSGPYTCLYLISYPGVQAAISTSEPHTFSKTGTTTYEGTFHAPQAASGTFQVSGSMWTPPISWSATTDIDPEPGRACPPGTVPSAGFLDVPADAIHAAAIDCVAWYGIAQGRTATEYVPRGAVNRAQMASFVARLIQAGGGSLPPPADQGFTDLDQAGVHADRINQLAAAGVVRGRTETTYAPTALVTRAQMATFLVTAYEYVAGSKLPAGTSTFTDIAGNPHETNIVRSATAGFALGTSETTYSPANPVRRDQMASFLSRVLERFAADGNTLQRP
jgi:hypothetical protein